MVVNIIVNYCCARVLLYAKMLKENETEETRRFCHLFLIGDISIGGNPSTLLLPFCNAYGALAMITRSWLFCYDMLGYCITKTCLFFFTLRTISCFILSRDVETEAVEAVKFLWKRKHFYERDRKRRRTRKQLILFGAVSGSKEFQR